MKYLDNVYVFNEIFQNATPLCPACFFLTQGANAHYLMMLTTYNSVILGWNTISTSFFILLKIILLCSSRQTLWQKHVAETCGRYCT